jgi:hypothetical protein
MWMWALMVLITVASMVVAGRMARARGRSAKVWLWVAAIIGPLGPLALYMFSDRHGKVTCTHGPQS